LIEGKRILIRGNAQTVEHPPWQPDITIRANRNEPCDILFWDNGPFNPPDPPPKLVMLYGWEANHFLVVDKCKELGIPFEYYLTTLRGINMPLALPQCWPCHMQAQLPDPSTRPFTGLLALYWVLMQNPTKVWLTGMDFYGQTTGRVGGHLVTPNIRWLKNLLLEDSLSTEKIGVDSTLRRIISSF